jgi:hypothetical protein
VAFNLLAADGYPSYYNMAKYGGTLWENWDNANGCDTPTGCSAHKNPSSTGFGVGSLNHIMYGGSVGTAVFGIGGIQPFVPPTAANGTNLAPHTPTDRLHLESTAARSRNGGGSFGRPNVAPVPWLPDAPRGSAVWRSKLGVTSASWAASGPTGTGGGTDGDVAHGGTGVADGATEWHVWVNVTVPPGSSGANIQVLLPAKATAAKVCAWECGAVDASAAGGVGVGGAATAATSASAPSFTSDWVTFDAGGGHHQFRAVVPPPSATAVPRSFDGCRPVWQSGKASVPFTVGVESVGWAPVRPGYTMFPALSLASTSGAYAVFARAC